MNSDLLKSLTESTFHLRRTYDVQYCKAREAFRTAIPGLCRLYGIETPLARRAAVELLTVESAPAISWDMGEETSVFSRTSFAAKRPQCHSQQQANPCPPSESDEVSVCVRLERLNLEVNRSLPGTILIDGDGPLNGSPNFVVVTFDITSASLLTLQYA